MNSIIPWITLNDLMAVGQERRQVIVTQRTAAVLENEAEENCWARSALSLRKRHGTSKHHAEEYLGASINPTSPEVDAT